MFLLFNSQVLLDITVIYMKGRERLSICQFTAQRSTTAKGLNQMEARSLELNMDILQGWQEPQVFEASPLPPGYVPEGGRWIWKLSRDSNADIAIWDASVPSNISTTAPNIHPKFLHSIHLFDQYVVCVGHPVKCQEL